MADSISQAARVVLEQLARLAPNEPAGNVPLAVAAELAARRFAFDISGGMQISEEERRYLSERWWYGR